jgi:glucan 1,4-alpha-glucosidase
LLSAFRKVSNGSKHANFSSVLQIFLAGLQLYRLSYRINHHEMKTVLLSLLLASALSISYAQTLTSPDKNFKLHLSVSPQGQLSYTLTYKASPVVATSKLGIELTGAPSLVTGFVLSNIDSSRHDSTWEPVWGEVKNIRNHYHELAVTLSQAATERTMLVRFRLFNDGLAFRYEWPRQEKLQHFVVKNEVTEFALTGDHKTFWIPGDYETNEYVYSTTKLSEVSPAMRSSSADEISTRAVIANGVQTPLMMKSAGGLYINIHEAALVNYPAMNLVVDTKTFTLTSHLVPDARGNKAYLQTPATTPWRTIIASNKAADILTSKTILNLNEPTKIENTDWIKPTKYIGIWWEMHVGTGTWNYSDETNLPLKNTHWSALKPNGRHAANTTNTKRYIDFAATHGFDGVLVEGWNVGWEDWFGQWKEEVFDFVTPYPDFDVHELHRYAAGKNVKLIMHHETSGSVTNYERRMDEAYAFMKANGYDAVKTGYVGRIVPRGEYHDGQWMVNHYNRVAEKTAAAKIMLDAHEPVRPTGLHRTYPNWLACEAARGQEFNAWSVGNPPEHETILPFTRLMGGPMDYTPGIFEIKMDYYVAQRPFNNQSPTGFQVHTTLAKQLALYVTLYSPLQMAADVPEAYEKRLDAFQFIKDVAVDWDDTKILEAEPGDYITTARKAKGKNEWYVGTISDENTRVALVNLNFLESNKKYIATIYADAADSHWKNNPMAYEIKKVLVDSKTVLKLAIAAGGGAAVSIKEANAGNIKSLKRYR